MEKLTTNCLNMIFSYGYPSCIFLASSFEIKHIFKDKRKHNKTPLKTPNLLVSFMVSLPCYEVSSGELRGAALGSWQPGRLVGRLCCSAEAAFVLKKKRNGVEEGTFCLGRLEVLLFLGCFGCFVRILDVLFFCKWILVWFPHEFQTGEDDLGIFS